MKKPSTGKSPAFQFYVQDFLTGTAGFTAEQVGGYMRLLCHQWDKGFLPNDDAKLLKISGVKKKALFEVKEKFSLQENNQLKNERLEIERAKQVVWRAKSAFGGKKSGETRRNHPSTTLEPPLPNGSNQNATKGQPFSLQSSNSNSTTEDTVTTNRKITTEEPSKLSADFVFEKLRIASLKNDFTDRQIWNETANFIERYKTENIKNLGALVFEWVRNMKPDRKELVI